MTSHNMSIVLYAIHACIGDVILWSKHTKHHACIGDVILEDPMLEEEPQEEEAVEPRNEV